MKANYPDRESNDVTLAALLVISLISMFIGFILGMLFV